VPEEPEAIVQVSLSRDVALVLFEMIAAQSDRPEIAVRDSAEQMAVWKLEGVLESILVEPLRPDYTQLVAEAKARLKA